MTTITERRATNYIDNAIHVWERYAIELGDNGTSADECVTLWLAPQVGNDIEWAYLTTNGDPVLVGYLEGENFTLMDSASEWINGEDMAWVRPLLEANFE